MELAVCAGSNGAKTYADARTVQSTDCISREDPLTLSEARRFLKPHRGSGER